MNDTTPIHENNGLTPEQIAIYRAMPPGRKLQIAGDLYWTARRLKAAALRSLHPNWPEELVQAKVRELFLYAAD